jgi:hypothetical protein
VFKKKPKDMNPMKSEWMDLTDYGIGKYDSVDPKTAKLSEEEYNFDTKMKVSMNS